MGLRLILAMLLLAPWSGGAHAAGRDRLRHHPLTVGFYVPWDDRARASLAGHPGRLDVFAPQWIAVRPHGDVQVSDDPRALELLSRDPRPPAILPLVSNAHDGIWDGPAAEQVIIDRATRDAFLTTLSRLAARRGFDGYVFDFETLTPAAAAAYPSFMKAARRALSKSGREAWVSIPAGERDWPLAGLSQASDTVVLLGYDACWQGSTPGPIAGRDWVDAIVRQRLAALAPARLVLALAAYGYDWPEGAPATVLGFEDAERLAKAHGTTMRRDPASENLSFRYLDPQDHRHDVWLVDAQAALAERSDAAREGLRGYAIWRLGLEDPRLWDGLRLPDAPPTGATFRQNLPVPHPCEPLATGQAH